MVATTAHLFEPFCGIATMRLLLNFHANKTNCSKRLKKVVSVVDIRNVLYFLLHTWQNLVGILVGLTGVEVRPNLTGAKIGRGGRGQKVVA